MSQSRNNHDQKNENDNNSFMTGCKAGMAETFVNHPLWTIKTRKQSGEPFTLNPRVLYKGVFSNAASMVPTTAVQMGVDQVIKNVVFKGKKELSSTENVFSGFVAGVASSAVSCPTEMMLTQMTPETGFFDAGKKVIAAGGVKKLFTGLFATATRDGKFAAGYLGVTPIIKELLDPERVDTTAKQLQASVLTGLGVSVASQAVDTVKTKQQKAKLDKPLNFMQAAKSVYAEKGARGFFDGAVPRAMRIMSAVTLFTMIKENNEVKPKM